MKALTIERLKAVLHYDASSGVCTWLPREPDDFNGDEIRCRGWNTAHAGKEAGCSALRYSNIRIDGKTYWLHRLVWFYVHGLWPPGLIDHKNGDKYDNRIENLRVVCHVGNAENRRGPTANKKEKLPLGVFKMPREGLPHPYMARIASRGVRRYLGSFATSEQAAEAYLVAKRAIHESNTL